MATLSKNILPIPESVVVGSGSYTVPSNKYGYLAATASTSAAFTQMLNSNVMGTGSGGQIEQWMSAGTSISTSTSGLNGLANGVTGYNDNNVYTFVATAQLNINGSAVLVVRSRMFGNAVGTSNRVWYCGDTSVGWSVSLFPIPVDNLPSALTT